MNKNLENIKLLYGEMLTLTLEMKRCISQQEFEALSQAIELKDGTLSKINKLKEISDFSEIEKAEMDFLKKELKLIEDNNIEEMESIKSNIAKELSSINKNTRIMAAYKVNAQVAPRLFDLKE